MKYYIIICEHFIEAIRLKIRYSITAANTQHM